MKVKTKQNNFLILLVLGMIVLIYGGCSAPVVDNSSESIVANDNTPQPTILSGSEDATSFDSVDNNEAISVTSTVTPLPESEEDEGEEDENEEVQVQPTITATPSPSVATIDTDLLEWKVAIPQVIDSCKFTIADSLGNSFILTGETLPGSPISCLSSWNSNGQQLAITSKNGIEIVDLPSMERSYFENPFLTQVIGEDYSLLNLTGNSWSKNNVWLAALARNRFGTNSLEYYQTVIFNTSSGESIQFEEGFDFKAWSPVNENAFAYISLESGGGNTPGIYHVGIWDVTSSQPVKVIEGLSEQYNIYNSQLIFSPDGNFAVLDAIEKETAASIILIIDFQQGTWRVLTEELANYIPWSWAPSGEWVSFYNSTGLYFSNNWSDGNPEITPLKFEGIFPIGWLPSEDIFVYEHNQRIYVFDPNSQSSRISLLDLTDIEANIGQYTSIAFWGSTIDD